MSSSSSSSSSFSFVRSGVLAGVAALGAFFAYRLVTRPRSVHPGINEQFTNTKPAEQFIERFETESREIFAKQHSVLSVLDVPASGRVADIGAGTGLFMSGLARAVGSEGHVYEVEPFEKFVDYLTQRRAQMEPELAERITVVQSTEFDIGAIPAGTLDLVIAIDAYHHFEYPTPLLRSIHRALKADGRLAILDFERIPGVSSEWILGHVRANKETVTEEVQACGFKVKENLKEKVKLEENYLLIFTKEETQ